MARSPRTVRGEAVRRFSADLSLEANARFEELARRLGATKSSLLQRMIDVLAMPNRERGERVCICSGERKISEIAGI